jgi:elongation factor Ts
MGTTTTDIEDIKWLREETGAGIMEAKKALQDAGGDREKARKLLEQRLGAHMEKRADRESAQGVVEAYIHHGGQVGVLVELRSETDFVARTPEFKTLAKEVALQVAATNPRYVSLEEIPAAEVEELKGQFRQEALKEGRPERILDNIAEGKFKKYAAGIVLLEQPYIRDDSRTIGQLVQEVRAKTRENVQIKRFARFQIGG